MWRGQEVGEVGSIVPLPEHVRQEPYSLPQGFHWVTLSSSDAEEVVRFLGKHSNYGSCVFDFFIMHPNAKAEWQFGIRTTMGKLVAVVTAFSDCFNIGGVSVPCMESIILGHTKYNSKRLGYVLTKELMRRANLHNINHYIFVQSCGLLKPITTFQEWQYNLDDPTSTQLPSSPKTPGWRRMTSEDVPGALAFINKWSSQFEIRRVFISEEETAYHLLCPSLPHFVYTYVVENKMNNITDLVSFRLLNKMYMQFAIRIVASTRTPIKKLLIDALVCAKELGIKALRINDLNIPDVLSSMPFHRRNKLISFSN